MRGGPVEWPKTLRELYLPALEAMAKGLWNWRNEDKRAIQWVLDELRAAEAKVSAAELRP